MQNPVPVGPIPKEHISKVQNPVIAPSPVPRVPVPVPETTPVLPLPATPLPDETKEVEGEGNPFDSFRHVPDPPSTPDTDEEQPLIISHPPTELVEKKKTWTSMLNPFG